MYVIDKHGYFAKRSFGSEWKATQAAAGLIGGRCATRRRADGSLTVYRVDVMKESQLELTVRKKTVSSYVHRATFQPIDVIIGVTHDEFGARRKP